MANIYLEQENKTRLKTEEYNQWYLDHIEEPIRPIVKLLRDNGFNTFCSCGHNMTVEMENGSSDDIDRLYRLLRDNGYKKIIISFWLETYPQYTRIIRVQLGDI